MIVRAADTLASAEQLLEQRRLSEAVFFFHRAEAQGCDADRCAAGRWMAAMLSGDFEAGWRESDSIRMRDAPDRNRLWQGADPSGKRVIVRCLHGLGDAVQFLRYIPLLKALAKQVIVECAPAMLDLTHCLAGIDEVITWGPSAPAIPPPWEVQIEIVELPYIFRSTLESIPVAPYLDLPTHAAHFVRQALGVCSQFRVGVVWASGNWNSARSLPLDLLHPVLERPEFQFWNLQGGESRRQWQDLTPQANLCDHPALDDAGLIPLAAFIAQLDLVITVDTLAAHLAGAINTPCFLMLQHASDWRWMIDHDDSPWYPSLRLFRQRWPGDWAGVVGQINSALDDLLLKDTLLRSTA